MIEQRTHTVTTYHRDTHYLYRVVDVVANAYFTANGGYVPARSLSFRTSEVKGSDPDYQEAIDYVNTIDRPF